MLIHIVRFCVAANGDEVEVVSAAAEESDENSAEEHSAEEESEEQSCHFHAGVEQVFSHPL